MAASLLHCAYRRHMGACGRRNWMEMSIYRGERAFALGVVGAATLLATMAGEYLMHNPTQAQVWHACLLDNCPTFDVFGYVPLPATTIVLPGGATLGIT